MKRGRFERIEPKPQKKANAGLLQTYVFSVLSLVLCCAMFLSTTFAWFTAEVENQGNEVYVGKLAVDLLDSVGNSLQDAEPVFDGNIKWEPGTTEYRTLHIVNTGDLSFNYRLLLTGGQGDRNIAKSISVYAIDGAVTPASRDEIANTWAYIGSLADVLDSALPLCKGEYDVPADLFVKNGEIRQNYYFFAELAPEAKLPGNCCEGRLEWVPFSELLNRSMPHTAYCTIRHYLETGRYTDVLYAGATTEDGVVFTPLCEF